MLSKPVDTVSGGKCNVRNNVLMDSPGTTPISDLLPVKVGGLCFEALTSDIHSRMELSDETPNVALVKGQLSVAPANRLEPLQ